MTKKQVEMRKMMESRPVMPRMQLRWKLKQEKHMKLWQLKTAPRHLRRAWQHLKGAQQCLKEALMLRCLEGALPQSQQVKKELVKKMDLKVYIRDSTSVLKLAGKLKKVA